MPTSLGEIVALLINAVPSAAAYSVCMDLAIRALYATGVDVPPGSFRRCFELCELVWSLIRSEGLVYDLEKMHHYILASEGLGQPEKLEAYRNRGDLESVFICALAAFHDPTHLITTYHPLVERLASNRTVTDGATNAMRANLWSLLRPARPLEPLRT